MVRHRLPELLAPMGKIYLRMAFRPNILPMGTGSRATDLVVREVPKSWYNQITRIENFHTIRNLSLCLRLMRVQLDSFQ